MKNILLIATVLSGLQALAGVTWYAVDPLSEMRYMPDSAPANGEKGGVVRIVAAKGEYEPGSFVLVSDVDLGKVRLEVGDLKQVERVGGGGDGGGERETGVVFPKANIDLKNVKVWYQNGNGWISYFLDKKLSLCPELLLNDEDLVKVDTEKRCNYARLTEKDGSVSYRWLNPPGEVDTRCEETGNRLWYRTIQSSFACMRENFSDAPTFQGVTLAKGVHKQIFLTVKVATNQPAGLYRGEIRIVSGHETGDTRRERLSNPTIQPSNNPTIQTIPVSLRVLDFELPAPATYFDCSKPFGTRFNQYISMDYILAANGGDRALAEKQMVAILKDFVAHGDINPRYRDRGTHPEWGLAAGQDFGNEFYSAGDMGLMEKAEARYDARMRRRKMTELCGWHRPYLTWNNEIGLAMLRAIRDSGMVRIYQEEGFRYALESKYGYESEAQLTDLYWPPRSPEGEYFDINYKMSTLGAGRGWYANQHVGVENPAFNRRQYGFSAYRSGLSCDANYAHHLSGWNDLAGELYKQMMFVYGTGNGCVDTLAWEGVREGLDDIRYATKLQQLANPLLDSDDVDVRYAARRAKQVLADADGDDMDLTALRLEMIERIKELLEVGRKLPSVGARVPRALCP